MDLSLLAGLLRRYGRLILPNLGAFLVSNFENGYELGRVSFSPFLRYNDGKFEQYLELDYSMPREEARKAVANYVDEIRTTLETTGVCVIPAVGVLRQASDGQLSFQLSGVVTSAAAMPSEADDTLSLDIPLIDETPPVLPASQEYSIPDGSHFAREVKKESAPEKKEQKEPAPFSLDGALAEVSYNAEAPELPPVSADAAPVSTGFNVGAYIVETTTVPIGGGSGFEVNDCLDALESLKSASGVATVPNDSVQEEQKLPIQTEVRQEVVQETPEKSESLVAAPITTVQEAEEGTPLREPLVNVRTTVNRAHKEQGTEYDSPWVSPKSTTRKSYRGRVVLILLLLVIALGVSDVLWFQQVTPYVGDVLESNGVLLRERPSVDVVASEITVSENPTTNTDAQAVVSQVSSEIEKEYNKRVQTENAPQISPTTNNTAIATNSPTTDARTSFNSSIDSRFFLVLGCFRNRDNAENYSVKLSSEGFQTRIIAQPSGMLAVTVGGYPTRSEALVEFRNIRLRHPEVWILER